MFMLRRKLLLLKRMPLYCYRFDVGETSEKCGKLNDAVKMLRDGGYDATVFVAMGEAEGFVFCKKEKYREMVQFAKIKGIRIEPRCITGYLKQMIAQYSWK